MSRGATRSFGFWLLLGVDSLFYFGLAFMFFRTRTRMPIEGKAGEFAPRPDEMWPDVAAEAVPSPTWALAAVGALAVAWALHRLRTPVAVVALATLAACAAMVLFWRHAYIDHGLITRFGQYAGFVWSATILWWVHAGLGLAGCALALKRGKRAAETPLLGRYLGFQTVWGLVLLPLVLLW